MKNRITRYLICLVLVLAVQLGKAQWSPDSIAVIEKGFSSWNQRTPGGVLQIARSGKAIYQKSFGMAELEQGTPNTPHSLFEAGSVSKQFTAAAILLLIKDRKLVLTDDVHRYIPELPDYGYPITVHHLLTHTSGIKDWGTVVAMGGWPRTSRVYNQQHVYATIFRQKSLNFIPGSAFAYSNSNHNLLVLLVERITGRRFVDFTQTELFDPVGMTYTGWRTDFRKVVQGRAVAYRASGNGYEQFMPFENTYGHAALLTTTADLIRWNQWLADKRWGDEFERLRLLPYTFANGTKSEYTCGALFVRTIKDQLEICHTGSTAGYRSWLAYYPELELSVAYLSNDASVPSIAVARLVSDLFVGAHPLRLPIKNNPASIQVTDLRAQVGLYKCVDGPEVLEWVQRGDSLYLARDPEWNGMYNDPWKTDIRQFKFSGTEVDVLSTNGAQHYRKVQAIDLSDARLSGLPGRYFSEEAGGEIVIDWSKTDNSFRMQFENGQSVKCVRAFVDGDKLSIIAANHVILTLEYGRKGIVGFTADLSQESFAMARADNLVFERR
ncbi:beta-lactamase family protein [Sphingobacterium sp. SGG-5]|uniref:serine hydrolase domain-containing protein n=1 Tax=Sphingobacterium sp. SGG-5 TaxID=2710881 RepID=UPI0013EA6B26|nr:serine hydrolase domain-containing protein [Sphingobacterium sp. SGG-5]NGM62175.1 beta-lactamase family protein [Sphingobacterium sp. SGG-5]